MIVINCTCSEGAVIQSYSCRNRYSKSQQNVIFNGPQHIKHAITIKKKGQEQQKKTEKNITPKPDNKLQQSHYATRPRSVVKA